MTFYGHCNTNDDYLLMLQGCIDAFHCANQGQSPLLNTVDDAKEFCKSRRALALLGEPVKESVSRLGFVFEFRTFPVKQAGLH